MKFLAVVAFAVCATIVAAEAEAEADASQFYGAYGYGAAPIAYGGYGAGYSLGYAPLAYGHAGYGYGARYGHFIGKREADASLGYGYAPLAYAYSPYAYGARASSFQSIATPFSVSAVSQIHKREAEPSADAEASIAYGYAPLAYAYSPYAYAPRASSFQSIATPFSVSTVSQIHKREAEPSADAEASIAYGYAPLAYAYGPGIAAHPGYATSFEHRSPQGLGLHSIYRPYGYAY